MNIYIKFLSFASGPFHKGPKSTFFEFMTETKTTESQESSSAEAEPVESVKPMQTEETEAIVKEEAGEQIKVTKDDSTSMDTSELDASKENSLSVSLFVNTDDVQDDLDDDLKEAAAAEAAKAAAAKSQEKQEEKPVKGDITFLCVKNF